MTMKKRIDRLERQRQPAARMSAGELLRRIKSVLKNPAQAAQHIGAAGVARVIEITQTAHDRAIGEKS